MSEENLINRWKNFKQPDITSLKCNICNFDGLVSNFKVYKARDIFHAGELIRYQCPKCDVIFGDLRFLGMTDDEIGNDYKDVYSYYKEGDFSSSILSIINHINLGKDKKYLDYACGIPENTLKLLNGEGYDVYGYDMYVKNKHPKFLKYIDKNTKFDVVYSNNFIEHLIHPYEDLQKLIDLLDINGKLVLMSPDWEYHITFTHYHTYFFTGRSTQCLCKKLNIKLIYDRQIYGIIVKIFEKIDKI